MNNLNFKKLDSIESALEDLKTGKMIIVVDDENRENEGDFVMAAEMITPEAVNFMSSVGKGLICTPLSPKLAKNFDLGLQTPSQLGSHSTAFTVSIDARENITTGISAADRSHTIKLLSQTQTRPSDFHRPGHIFPLISKAGGVLERPGHTEASVDLVKLCGFSEAAVICEIINPDGSMARLPQLFELAEKYELKVISIADLILYRKRHENLISGVENVQLATKFGQFELYHFQSKSLQEEHLAIVKGPVEKLKTQKPLIRIHSECFTGDVLGSLRCDCADQLHKSLELIEKAGSGMVIYLKQEGRGIGLLNKIYAYKLQDEGLDTVEANRELGLAEDARDYTMAWQILKHFEISSVEILTNNPQKIAALEELGHIQVKQCSLEIAPHEKNINYLLTKKQKFGHILKQVH